MENTANSNKTYINTVFGSDSVNYCFLDDDSGLGYENLNDLNEENGKLDKKISWRIV